MIDTTLKLLFKRLGLLLVLYLLLRLIFYAFNFSSFSDASASSTFLAFIYGLRFDVAAITAINAPFILLSLVPWGNLHHTGYQKFLKVWFILTNAPFIALALVDVEFFKFIGKRSSSEITGITADISNQLGQLLQYYWYMPITFAFFVWLIAKAYPKHIESKPTRSKTWVLGLRLLLVAGVAVIAIRGGFQLKPLRVNHAFVLEPTSLGHLSLNSPFTFIKGIGKAKLEPKTYFQDEHSLLTAMQFKPTQFASQVPKANKENVVIIILESFAAEYVGALNNGKGYTPFLDSLATQGVLFQNAFANGRKSIEALPSILAGIPSLMQEPYITSPYQANKLIGLGTVLGDAGYSTAFFHGATNGTMGFNNFSKQAGMQSYYGLDEYPSKLRDKDFDGQWGIFDEPYLQYVSGELGKFQKPFFATIFTLSSHHPYTIPKQYKGHFAKGNLEIHESIGYADYALKQFFKNAAKQSWYTNTLFVITADHTQKSSNKANQDDLGAYRVPLLLFHPSKELGPVDTEQVLQHVDIMPTLVDYLGVKTTKLLPFGRSVFNNSTSGKALLYNDNTYLLVKQDATIKLTPDDNVEIVCKEGATLDDSNSGNMLKAYVQYYQQGLVNNSFYSLGNKFSNKAN